MSPAMPAPSEVAALGSTRRELRGILVLGGLILALIAGGVALAWPHSSTLVPRNGGLPIGDPSWAQLFRGCMKAAFVAYAAAVLAASRGRLATRPAIAVAIAIQVMPLAAPLILSTDAWSYWNYARIAAIHDANPYVQVPADFPLDAAFEHGGKHWIHTPSVYGPAFTLVSEPVAGLVGDSPDVAAWMFKSIAASSMIGVVLLLARFTKKPSFAVVLVGWSPVLAIHAAGAGHNDALLAVAMIGAIAAMRAARPLLGGALWAIASLIKWVPILLLPLAAIAAWRTSAATRDGRAIAWRAAAGFCAVGSLVGAIATWRYGLHWIGAFGAVVGDSSTPTQYALGSRLSQIGFSPEVGASIALGVLALAGAWILRSALAGGRARLGLAALALVACSPRIAVWYLLWAVPLAASDEDAPAAFVAVGLTAYLVVYGIRV